MTNQALAGKVWVANFIFTTCKTICPLLTSKMVQLQRLTEGMALTFVSFSVDPAHDTPAVLAAYAQRWAPDEARWQLLATDEKTLPSLARGFRVTATPSSDPAALDAVIHSSVFVLVDREGLVRGVYDSEAPQDLEALRRGITTLVGTPLPAPSTEKRSGLELYHALSCDGCHEQPALAPALGGLGGTRRELENGLSATFDEGYVRESLLSPEAKRVRGYPLRMPSYEGLMTAEELGVLTQHLLSAESVAQVAAAAAVELDPVCHMKVRAAPDTLSASHGGHTFFFCSSHCRRRFEAAPTAFLSDQGDAGALMP